jgi:hypothetical protein
VILKKVGLVPCKEEPYLFIDKHRKVIIVFFINNALVLYYREQKAKVKELITKLYKVYEMHLIQEIKWFLEI